MRPVIKSPKEVKGLVVDPAALRYRLFLPPINPAVTDPEKELRARYPMAYRYVDWGRRQRTPRGQPWPKVPSVAGRKAWWLLPATVLSNLLWVKSYDDTFRELIADEPVFPDQRVYAVVALKKKQQPLLGALLNCCWTFLETELKGRVNLGDGALDTAVYEVKSFLIPDPNVFSNHSRPLKNSENLGQVVCLR